MELWQAAPPVYMAFLIISEWGRKNYLFSLEETIENYTRYSLNEDSGFFVLGGDSNGHII